MDEAQENFDNSKDEVNEISKRTWIYLGLLWLIAVITTSAAIFIVMNNIHFTRVLSGSMAPEFHTGDTLMVKPVPKRELQIGQVAVLPSQDDDSQFAHRIISVKKSGPEVFVKTKGDANSVADPWTLRIISAKVPIVVAVLPTKDIPIPESTLSTRLGGLGLMLLVLASMITPAIRRKIPPA